jgi:sterol desaturase/sphingolipid hydroxylase (fatty acid hydroxylase superfamily)
VNAWIQEHELAVRLGSFVAIFVVMALWELAAPRRRRISSKLVRWVNNLGIVAFNSVLLRLVLPAGAMGVAWLAAERGWGLLNIVHLPFALAVVLSVVVLDFVIYLQHVLFHAVPGLWRLHMVHHADLDFDVTTGTRFHPVEILISMLIKMAIIAALGPPVLAVLIFEILLNGTSVFNHGNLRLPGRLDRILRWIVVTPDMHRVHHSVVRAETNSNFGFNLPWWDRLLGTYRAQPAAGHEGMTIGIEQFQQAKTQTLPWLLALPFAGKTGGYPIGHRDRESR